MTKLFIDTLTKVLSPKIAFRRVRNPSASITVNLVFSHRHLLCAAYKLAIPVVISFAKGSVLS